MDAFQCRVERDFVCVQGDDAESYLQSQLSNQIQGMPVRSSKWSLLLQPTGKVDAVVRVTRFEDTVFVLDTDHGFGEAVVARLERLLAGDGAASETAEPIIEEPLEPEAPMTAFVPDHPASQSFLSSAVPPLAPTVEAKLAGSETRRFEFVGGSSSKFWEATLAGAALTVRFGRIGTPGQSQTKHFADAAKARSERDKLAAEKLKKGYVERRA